MMSFCRCDVCSYRNRIELEMGVYTRRFLQEDFFVVVQIILFQQKI